MKDILNQEEYNFLKSDKRFGDNMILLGIVGSNAYGTNHDDSDVDLMGCTLNSGEEILLGKDFESYRDENTDTIIYSVNNFIDKLANCNPSMLELLGLRPEFYLIKTDIGDEILKNKEMFISKRRVIGAFKGFANQQLNRLNNNISNFDDSKERENMLRSLENVKSNIEKGWTGENITLNLYLDDDDIKINMDMKGQSLMEFDKSYKQLSDCMRSYRRNRKLSQKKDDKHLCKHMMNMIRSYMVCIDILKTGEIITYRENEHELLMDLLNGEYLDSANREVDNEFWKILDEYKDKLREAEKETKIPLEPDWKKIDKLRIKVNKLAVERMK